MRESFTDKVAWRRRGVRRPYVGTLEVSEGGITLSGRDPVSGVEVVLSIPMTEVEDVHVARAGEASAVSCSSWRSRRRSSFGRWARARSTFTYLPARSVR
jgi:hypothetical protein